MKPRLRRICKRMLTVLVNGQSTSFRNRLFPYHKTFFCGYHAWDSHKLVSRYNAHEHQLSMKLQEKALAKPSLRQRPDGSRQKLEVVPCAAFPTKSAALVSQPFAVNRIIAVSYGFDLGLRLESRKPVFGLPNDRLAWSSCYLNYRF